MHHGIHAFKSWLKSQYINNPALESNCGEPSEKLPYRWAATRLQASVKVCVDLLNGKTQEFFLELPDPV